MTRAQAEGEPVEVMSERSETTSVFALPDGTMAAGIASGPVRVRTGGDGTAPEDWAAVDVTLRVGEDGMIRPGAHIGNLEISGGTPSGIGPDEPVTVLSMTNVDGTVSTIGWEGPLPAPRVEGARAVYEDVRQGVDMVIEATATGVEQFFVIQEVPDEALVLPVELSADGADVRSTAEGTIEVRGRDGSVHAHSPEPTMWDAVADVDRVHPVTRPWEPLDAALEPIPAMPEWAAGRAVGETPGSESRRPATPGRVATGDGEAGAGDPRGPAMAEQVEVAREVHQVDRGSVRMDLAPQAAFLNDSATVYPVVIDPEYNLQAYFDTFVQSNSSSDLSASSELLMGSWNGGTTVARSFANFTNNVVAGATVFEARLYLNEHHSYSCQARNWQVWGTGLASTATRWNNQPAWVTHHATSSETRGYSSACPDGYVAAGVTTLLQQAAAAPLGSVFAIGLKAENEADSYAWKRFYSSEAGAGPFVWVRFNTAPATPTALTVSPITTTVGGVAYTSSVTPSLGAAVTDPQGGSLGVYFELLAHGVAVTTGYAEATSGTVAQWTVPAGLVLEGQLYTFRALAFDGEAQSAWSTEQAFVAQRSPSAPTGAGTTSPASPCVTGPGRPVINSETPMLRATVADPDGGNSQARFQVYNASTGALVWDPPLTSPRASGSQHAIVVPAGVLAEGVPFQWRVGGQDLLGSSGPVVACEFVVDLSPPSTPNVVAAATGTQPSVQHDVPLTVAAGEVVEARAWVRTPAGVASGSVCLSAVATGVERSCTPFAANTSWTQVHASLGVSTGQSEIRFEVYQSSGSAQVWLDDVNVTKTSSLANGSLELGATGWTSAAPAVFTVTANPQSAHSGAQFGTVSRPGTAGSVYRDVALPAGSGESVEARVWLRSGVGTATGNACVVGMSGSERLCVPYAVGTTWTQVVVNLGLRTAQSTIRFEINPSGGSQATWFDDVTLAKRELFVNGTFELGAVGWAVVPPANFVVYDIPSIAHSGNRLGATNRPGGTGSIQRDLAVNVSPGEILDAKIWLHAEWGGTATGVVCLWGLTGGPYENACTRYAVPAAYTPVSVSLGVVAAHSLVRFEIYPDGGSPTLWFDDATLTKSSVASSGSFELGGAGWTAVAPATFAVGTTAPHSGVRYGQVARPSTAVYAEDQASGGVGQMGMFELSAGPADISSYRYSFNDDSLNFAAAAGPWPTWIAFTPSRAGPQTLYVQSVDRSGSTSPVRVYRFIVAGS
jgi:hypothetical protein